MKRARFLAEQGNNYQEVPVGAIVLCEGHVIAEAHNCVEIWNDPCAHAEALAMKKASHERKSRFLTDCTLVVTLEPCALCAAAAAAYRIERVIFGAYDPKTGGVEHGARVFSHAHHKPDIIGGLQEQECADLLSNFFAGKRL